MGEEFRLRRALRRMPGESADPAAWDDIAARADALGLWPSERGAGHESAWRWPLTLAATVLVAVAMVRVLAPPPEAVAVTADEAATVDVLMRQSQLLEAMLRNAPPAPRIVTVGTASRETALRDRIAAIDLVLSGDSESLSERAKAELWSERSQRMRELVDLRYRDVPRSDL